MPGPQIHPLPAPRKKPIGYIADPDKGIDYHWIPDKNKKVSELVEIKNDVDRLHELRKARDMAATEARITVTKLGALTEEDHKTWKLRRKKCFILTQKIKSPNIL